MAPSAAEVAAQFQARPAAGAVVPWEEPSAAAARWERPAVAAAVRSVAPSAAEVAAQLPAHPAGGGVLCRAVALYCRLRLLRGRWCRPLRRLLRSCRRTRRMRLLCRGRRCLWLRLLRGRRSWRTAAIVTPFLRGRGRRLPGRLLRGRRCGLRRLLLGCRCLLRLLLRGRRLRWRAAAAFGRALLAALLRRRRLRRGWGGLRLRTLSRRSRRSSGWRRLSLGWCLWCLRAWRRGRRLWLYLGRRRRPGLRRCSRRLSGLVGRFGRCSLRYDERPIERRGKSRGRQRCNRQQRGAGQQQRTDVQAYGQAWIHGCAGSGWRFRSE